MLEDNLRIIDDGGMGRISFDPRGLKSEKYVISIPPSMWQEPNKRVVITLEHNGVKRQFDVKELFENSVVWNGKS